MPTRQCAFPRDAVQVMRSESSAEQMNVMKAFLAVAAVIVVFFSSKGQAQSVSTLFARGYQVIPEPQNVSLGNNDIRFGSDWQLSFDQSVPNGDVAVETLQDELSNRFDVSLGSAPHSAGVVSLRIADNSVQVWQGTGQQ